MNSSGGGGGSENGGSTDYENDTTSEPATHESSEGPLLPEAVIPFQLTAPSPMPHYLNVHFICESASRLLFLSVHWVRNIPSFQCLR